MDDPQNSVVFGNPDKQNQADDLAANVNMQDEQPEERHDTRAPDLDEDGEFNTIDEPVMTTIVSISSLSSTPSNHVILTTTLHFITEKRS